MTRSGDLRHDRAVVDGLIAAGRYQEAQRRLASAPGAPEQALVAHLAQVEARPASSVAEHNLAAFLGDQGLHAASEGAARRAFAKGGDAPETWLVLGRALVNQYRFDEAEQALRQAITRRPTYGEALRELAQLIWMRTADAEAATAPVRAALAHAPGDPGLRRLLGLVMEFAGADPREIWRVLAEGGPIQDPQLHLSAVGAALGFDRDLALRHALAAFAGAPDHPVIALKLAEVLMMRGDLDQAATVLADVRLPPEDQNLLAHRATLERLAGAPNGVGLNDYDAFVQGAPIDVPPGWPDLAAYLRDLATALRAMHRLRTHPIGQSLRHGSQTPVNLTQVDDPAVQAFFTAVDGPIRRYMARLGAGTDPLRRRNTGDYRIIGCWSVLLSSGGFHASHVHPQGWLSSACHIELPEATQAGGREGWLALGSPPGAYAVPTPPERHERPEPGRLMLFPSYMWHQTLPFAGPDDRLTIAFDLIPA